MQFQGVSDALLYAVLLGGVSMALAVHGVAELLRRRFRGAFIALASAMGAVAAAMIIDGIIHHRRGSRRRWDAWSTARLAAIAGSALTVGVAVVFRDRPGAVWMAVLAFQAAVAVAVFYASVYAQVGMARMAVLMALRCLAVFALLVILFKPALSFFSGGSAKPFLAILVDRSASMAVADGGGRTSRYLDAVTKLLAQRSRIERNFRPLWYEFAERVHTRGSPDELAELSPRGAGADGTDIAAAIALAAQARRRGRFAGVLLLSDGIHNAAGAPAAVAAENGVSVFTAAAGTDDESTLASRNVRILSVEAPMTVAMDNTATITARVRITGLRGRDAELRLIEGSGGEPVKTVVLQTAKDAHVVTARLEWTPRAAAGMSADKAKKAEADVRKLTIEIPPVAGELTTADNTAELHVLVTRPEIRVLYVEGTIRPEYKWLKRRLARDPNVQLTAMVRISENRFWVSGGIDGRRLTGLPSSAEELSLFDVVILGDLDVSFFRTEQMRLIRQFVDDGGGLLMLGGHNSFGPGGYGGTDLEAVLPVIVGGRDQRQEMAAFLPELTAAGRAHPIFNGLGDYFPRVARSGGGARTFRPGDLLGCVRVVRAKSSAEVLAIHPRSRNAAGPLVVLATQRFGAGRSAALTADTTWKWRSPRGGKGLYERFWGQLVRWLARAQGETSEGPTSLVLAMDSPNMLSGGEVRLTARLDGPQARTTDAKVSCVVIEPGGQIGRTFALSPTRDSRLFETTFSTDKAALLRLAVSAEDPSGATLGSDELPLAVIAHSVESARLARNDKLLADIAKRSGGSSENISHLGELIEQIIQRHGGPAASAKPRIVRLYNFTALFIVFVALVTGEWLLRRRWQLH
ncbi:MAG: hypothetical protein J7M14_06820 [Planctomycetes bacterium]|nr:hypothetical protein [Planctomycetota bacterium]